MEVTIFTVLQSILYKKNKLTFDELEEFENLSPYMLNNWLSAYDDRVLEFLNETTNVSREVFKNKYMMYEYYYNVIPKLKYKKLKYPRPKKIKEEEDKNEISSEILDFYSKNLELSRKEIKYLIDKNVIDISNWK